MLLALEIILFFFNLAKSSSAWYDDLVSGDEDTNRKPFALAITSKSLNSLGS